MAWVHNVSIQTLGKIAGVGGLLLLGTSTYLKIKLRDKLMSTPMYKSALGMLRTHPGAVSILGEPIVEGIIKIDYRENYCDGQNAYYKIPVRGPKTKADYYFWAERVENEFVVTKSELELSDDDTKRLIIMKGTPKPESDTSTERQDNKVEFVKK